jgi:hypothetical protein
LHMHGVQIFMVYQTHQGLISTLSCRSFLHLHYHFIIRCKMEIFWCWCFESRQWTGWSETIPGGISHSSSDRMVYVPEKVKIKQECKRA